MRVFASPNALLMSPSLRHGAVALLGNREIVDIQGSLHRIIVRRFWTMRRSVDAPPACCARHACASPSLRKLTARFTASSVRSCVAISSGISPPAARMPLPAKIRSVVLLPHVKRKLKKDCDQGLQEYPH